MAIKIDSTSKKREEDSIVEKFLVLNKNSI